MAATCCHIAKLVNNSRLGAPPRRQIDLEEAGVELAAATGLTGAWGSSPPSSVWPLSSASAMAPPFHRRIVDPENKNKSAWNWNPKPGSSTSDRKCAKHAASVSSATTTSLARSVPWRGLCRQGELSSILGTLGDESRRAMVVLAHKT